MSTAGYAFVMREFANNGIEVWIEPPFDHLEIRCPEGKELSDFFKPAMIAVLNSESMQNCCLAALSASTHSLEPLVCTVCGEALVTKKSNGAASKKKKCAMTPRCEGIYRRVEPKVFYVKPRAGFRGRARWSYQTPPDSERIGRKRKLG
jgi:phage FluMu protein Com